MKVRTGDVWFYLLSDSGWWEAPDPDPVEPGDVFRMQGAIGIACAEETLTVEVTVAVAEGVEDPELFDATFPEWTPVGEPVWFETFGEITLREWDGGLPYGADVDPEDPGRIWEDGRPLRSGHYLLHVRRSPDDFGEGVERHHLILVPGRFGDRLGPH